MAISHSLDPQAPEGWSLEKPLFATPTIVLFENGKEVSRYTGYNGDKARFWQWLGFRLLSEEQRRIAFEKGTEYAFTGSHLDETRPGTFVDPITGAALFRTDTKFDSGTGWPSFFNPLPGALSYHEDRSLGMVRTEVRSASSAIHLGHVFDDGPPPPASATASTATCSASCRTARPGPAPAKHGLIRAFETPGVTAPSCRC
ncbi:MAG: hypothetical protein KatS3mg128_1089 [Silanimonas sp.]|nr:MAG: hypothetical protein KatS3mg128_1089 [Silanimonas sp.]